MRRLLALPLLILALWGLAYAQKRGASKADQGEEVKREVLESEDQQNAALLKNDANLLANMCADELAWTNASGVLLSKAKMLDDMRAGKQRNTTIQHEDVRVHLYGTTAVVTGLSTSTYVYQGKTFVGSRRFTNVWVKQAGRWMLVVHHVTPVANS